MTNPETRTEQFFPEQKFQPGQLLQSSVAKMIRGRLEKYIIEGDKLIAVIKVPGGGEYGDDQENFVEVPDP